MKKRLIIVVGMHRSGTSAIAHGLSTLGVNLGDRLLPPVIGDNDKGYFEDIDVNALNMEMLQFLGLDWDRIAAITANDIERLQQHDFFSRAVALIQKKTEGIALFGLKDPRIARLFPFWGSVCAQCNLEVTCLLAVRNPLSVVKSLAKRGKFDPAKGYYLWLCYMLDGLRYTRGYTGAVIDYDHLLADPRAQLIRIASQLNLSVDDNALNRFSAAFLDTGLRHSRFELKDLSQDAACPPLVYEMYAKLSNASHDGLDIFDARFEQQVSQWIAQFDGMKSCLWYIDKLFADIAKANSISASGERQIRELFASLMARGDNTVSRVFDAEGYLARYPDVAAAGANPYIHFVRHGLKEGRSPPNGLFSLLHDALHSTANELALVVARENAMTESHLRDLALQELQFVNQMQQERRAQEDEWSGRVEELRNANSNLAQRLTLLENDSFTKRLRRWLGWQAA